MKTKTTKTLRNAWEGNRLVLDSHIPLRVPLDVSRRIKKIARAKGVPRSTLIRIWIYEKLKEVDSNPENPS